MKMVFQAGVASFVYIVGLFSGWLMPQKTVMIQAPAPVVSAPMPLRTAPRAIVHKMAKTAPVQALLATAPASEVPMARLATPHGYDYILSGRLTDHGQPVAHSTLNIWITTPRMEETRTLMTGSDGSYSLHLNLDDVAGDPVDWEIRGQNAGMKTVKVSGRRILMDDEPTLNIEQALDFQAD